jgi:8-oxo-dGTP diphosphatase
MGQRKGAHGAGTYAFPGGKPDEQGLYGAALRELVEETGLAGTPIAYLGDVYREFEDKDRGLQRWRTLYALVSAQGEPQTCEPEKSYGWNWYDLDALPEPLFPPAAEFICAGRLAQAAAAWLEHC